MRVFQSTYRDRKTGEPKKTKRWYVELRDHNRTVRRLPAFNDRRQSEACGRRLEQLVAMRANREAPDLAMMQWLETIPDSLRAKLGEIGIIDARRAAASKPLSEHITDFRASLESKGRSIAHVALIESRVHRLLVDVCGCTFWSDISPSLVERNLRAMQDEDGMSAQTRNHYIAAAKQFASWTATAVHPNRRLLT